LHGLFEVSWNFPSVEPPEYLRQLSPQLHQQEALRVAERFDEALHLAGQALTEELAKPVSYLTERLSGTDDGKPKVFRDSAVGNLLEFFSRFRYLSIRSSTEFDQLVDRTQRLVRCVEPQALHNNSSLRQQIGSQLAGVQAVLDGLLVDQSLRNILRRAK